MKVKDVIQFNNIYKIKIYYFNRIIFEDNKKNLIDDKILNYKIDSLIVGEEYKNYSIIKIGYQENREDISKNRLKKSKKYYDSLNYRFIRDSEYNDLII